MVETLINFSVMMPKTNNKTDDKTTLTNIEDHRLVTNNKPLCINMEGDIWKEQRKRKFVQSLSWLLEFVIHQKSRARRHP